MCAPADFADSHRSARVHLSFFQVHNGTVYLAGQVPETTGPTGASAEVQTAEVLALIDALLAKVGSSKDRILSATCYLTDIRDIAGMNAAWIAWAPAGHTPARATVGGVQLASSDWKVEISVIAAL